MMTTFTIQDCLDTIKTDTGFRNPFIDSLKTKMNGTPLKNKALKKIKTDITSVLYGGSDKIDPLVLTESNPLLDPVEIVEHVAVTSAFLAEHVCKGLMRDTGFNNYSYDIHSQARQNVISYTLKSRQFDQILQVMTKSFCANACEDPPIGCCDSNYHIPTIQMEKNPHEVILAFDKLQAVEGTKNPDLQEHECEYHSDLGCALTITKPPLCMKWSCRELNKYILHELGYDSYRFMQSLVRLPSQISEFNKYWRKADQILNHGVSVLIETNPDSDVAKKAVKAHSLSIRPLAT